jgi:hypothetical protein
MEAESSLCVPAQIAGRFRCANSSAGIDNASACPVSDPGFRPRVQHSASEEQWSGTAACSSSSPAYARTGLSGSRAVYTFEYHDAVDLSPPCSGYTGHGKASSPRCMHRGGVASPRPEVDAAHRLKVGAHRLMSIRLRSAISNGRVAYHGACPLQPECCDGRRSGVAGLTEGNAPLRCAAGTGAPLPLRSL